MNKNDGYPTENDMKDRERSFWAGRMEEEAQIRAKYGDPSEREHERLRVSQEWDKIEADKKKGLSDYDIWQNHVDRMKRMAESLKNAGKALRRARHFELAGLTTASKFFNARAQQLAGDDSEGQMDAQKDILVSNLTKFSEWANLASAKRYLEL